MKRIYLILTAIILAAFAVPAMAQTAFTNAPSYSYSGNNASNYKASVETRNYHNLNGNGSVAPTELEKDDNGNAISHNGSNLYVGYIEIPDTVVNGNKKYPVTTLAKGANGWNTGDKYGAGTFQYSGITTVKLPKTLTEVGQAAFAKCPFLEYIHVDTLNKDFFDDNGVLYQRNKTNGNYDGTYTLVAVPGMRDNITILEGTTVIKNSAFDGCKYIKKVTIPATVTKIGMWAFVDCGLEELTCLATTPPKVYYDSNYGNEAEGNWNNTGYGIKGMVNQGKITVYVPEGTITSDKYNNTNAGWNKLGTLKEITIVKETTFEPVDYLRYERNGDKVVGIKQIEITDPNGEAFKALPEGWTVTGELFKDGTTEIETTVTYKATVTFPEDNQKTVIVNVSDDDGNIPERNGIYTLHIPAGSLVTEDGRECIESKPTYGIEYAEPNRTTVTHNVQLTILDSDANYSWSYKKGEKNVVYDTKAHVIGEEINGAVENEVVVTNTTITQVTHRYYSTELVYSRVFKNAEWQPLFVPFAMDYSDWKDQFEVARITDVYDNGGSSKVLFYLLGEVLTSGSTEANTPYLIRAKSANATVPKLLYVKTGKTIEAPSENNTAFTVNGNTYNIKGQYTKTKHAYNDGKTFVMAGGVLKHPHQENGANLGACRWVLTIDAANPAAKFSFGRFDNDGTTGIEEVTTENVTVKGIYDLSGRKLDAVTEPGVYIIDGKKVLVK